MKAVWRQRAFSWPNTFCSQLSVWMGVFAAVCLTGGAGPFRMVRAETCVEAHPEFEGAALLQTPLRQGATAGVRSDSAEADAGSEIQDLAPHHWQLPQYSQTKLGYPPSALFVVPPAFAETREMLLGIYSQGAKTVRLHQGSPPLVFLGGFLMGSVVVGVAALFVSACRRTRAAAAVPAPLPLKLREQTEAQPQLQPLRLQIFVPPAITAEGCKFGLILQDTLQVVDVEEPAFGLGWRVGDRIIQVNGADVSDRRGFFDELGKARQHAVASSLPIVFDVQRFPGGPRCCSGEAAPATASSSSDACDGALAQAAPLAALGAALEDCGVSAPDVSPFDGCEDGAAPVPVWITTIAAQTDSDSPASAKPDTVPVARDVPAIAGA